LDRQTDDRHHRQHAIAIMHAFLATVYVELFHGLSNVCV